MKLYPGLCSHNRQLDYSATIQLWRYLCVSMPAQHGSRPVGSVHVWQGNGCTRYCRPPHGPLGEPQRFRRGTNKPLVFIAEEGVNNNNNNNNNSSSSSSSSTTTTTTTTTTNNNNKQTNKQTNRQTNKKRKKRTKNKNNEAVVEANLIRHLESLAQETDNVATATVLTSYSKLTADQSFAG